MITERPNHPETTIKTSKMTLVQNLTMNLTIYLVQILTFKMAEVGPEPA